MPPSKTPLFLAFYTLTVGYNLYELSYCFNPSLFIERGNVPFVSYFNGYNKIGFAANFLRRHGLDPYELQQRKAISILFSMPEIYHNYVHQISRFNLGVFYILNGYGNYQLVESVLLTGKNFFCYFKDRPYITVCEEGTVNQPQSAQISFPNQKGKRSKKRVPSQSDNQIIKSSYKLSVQEIGAEPNKTYLNEPKDKGHQNLPKINKIKTRNPADPEKASKPLDLLKERPFEEQINDNILRKNGLETIRELRMQYPVKVVTMNKAIMDLETFLTAVSVARGGSKWKFVWKHNHKQYSLKYEIPHKYDSTNYIGNKLDWILNVLEVGFLFGLSPNVINAYLSKNQDSKILRYSKFICFLALNPNK